MLLCLETGIEKKICIENISVLCLDVVKASKTENGALKLRILGI